MGRKFSFDCLVASCELNMGTNRAGVVGWYGSLRDCVHYDIKCDVDHLTETRANAVAANSDGRIDVFFL